MEHDHFQTDSRTETESHTVSDFQNPEPQPASGREHLPSARDIRKAHRKEKRRMHQIERARIREHLHAGLRDPDVYLDLESQARNGHRKSSEGGAARQALLAAQGRKLKSELANTRDLEGFLAKASRSRTLYTLVAMGYFRQVLHSDAFREDHRYKVAIRHALEEPGLAKAIQRRWECFDREFPEGVMRMAG